MSTVNNGPQIVRNGLVLGLDASARGSYLPNSLINMNNWTVSSGSVTGYGQNGATNENQRFAAANPWGHTGIIWGSFPSGNGNDDGGWNTDWFNIDNTKLYRFSVWVKRTSDTTGGTFYLGMYANGDESRRMDNSTVEGNAYWNCTSTSGLTKDVWYLYVGHVYPFNTSYTGKHPDTGYYFVNNPVKQGDVNGCNIGAGDLKWSSNSTTGIHRTYHYYCADNTTRLQFYDPRVDLVDGKQPSITELVNRSPLQWKDLSGNSNNGTLTNGPLFDSGNKGSILFDGSDDTITTNLPLTNFPSYSSFTFETWVKITAYPAVLAANGYGVTYQTGVLMGATYYCGAALYWYGNASGNAFTLYGFIRGADAYRSTSGYNFSLNQWYHCVMVNNAALGTLTLFINGSLYSSTSTATLPYDNTLTSTAGNIGISKSQIDGGGTANYKAFGGQMASARIYNRALTNAEITQNYEATRTRFGL